MVYEREMVDYLIQPHQVSEICHYQLQRHKATICTPEEGILRMRRKCQALVGHAS